jgi:hypothetical protein
MKKQETNINNNIFIHAFTGAILFIAAMAFTVANLSSIAMFELSYVFIAAVLCTSSVSLLYTAIKNDKDRLSQI